MKLSTKLSGSFGFLVMLVVGLGGAALVGLATQDSATRAVVDNWMPRIEAVGKLNASINAFRRAEFGHILSDGEDAMRDSAARLEEYRNRITTEAEAYEQHIASDEERGIFEEFRKEWNGYLTVHEQLLLLSEMGLRDKAFILASGESRRTLRAALVQMDRLIEINREGGVAAGEHATIVFDQTRIALIVAMILAGVVGAVLAVVLIRNVLTQLGEDPGYLRLVSAQIAAGNLDVALRPGRGGVYGVFVQMVGALKDKIAEADRVSAEAQKDAEVARQASARAEEATLQAMRSRQEGMTHAAEKLEEIVEVLTSASEQLSAQIEQARRGAEDQAARTGETATAMEEMNATVLEVARNAAMAAKIADTAKIKAEEGAIVVDNVVQGIGEVQRQSLDLKEDMGKLGRQAEGIGGILGVISDIADQTNLLALNAAIEAARAGDAGRGFAVVADEVRKLAEKTMTATKEVGDAIRGIQDGTRLNVLNVERSGQTIGEATRSAGKSGEALREIVALVENASDQARSIATAAEEQSSASEEINRSIEDVSRISSETTNVMRQSEQAVMELARQALVLKKLIEELKSEGQGAVA